MIDAFVKGVPLDELADARQGLATADNDRFLRQWFEVRYAKIKLDAKNTEDAKKSNQKWFPYNKGGAYRKWYGNNDYVVNWENDGLAIKNFCDESGKQRSVIRNPIYYFKECITWSKITSSTTAFRYKSIGHVFDVAGTSIFVKQDLLLYLHGLCNSKVISTILGILSPTLNYEVGHIASIPVILNNECMDTVKKLTKDCNSLSRDDWDTFETSWDFKKHPLI